MGPRGAQVLVGPFKVRALVLLVFSLTSGGLAGLLMKMCAPPPPLPPLPLPQLPAILPPSIHHHTQVPPAACPH